MSDNKKNDPIQALARYETRLFEIMRALNDPKVIEDHARHRSYKLAGQKTMVDGVTLAPCNNPANNFTVAQIEAARNEPIDLETFLWTFSLIQERFDKEYDSSYLKVVYIQLCEHMGHDEFVAAVHDSFTTRLFFPEIVPFLIQRANAQRENGPDLWKLQIAEQFGES